MPRCVNDDPLRFATSAIKPYAAILIDWTLVSIVNWPRASSTRNGTSGRAFPRRGGCVTDTIDQSFIDVSCV
jgi:hypothetical protein